MCLICFLKDKHQYSLRRSSILRSDRIEHTLDRYKYAFINSFHNSHGRLCELHNNEANKSIEHILGKIDNERIFEFFDALRKVYINWINAKTGPSIDILTTLLENYGLIDINSGLQSDILFRGRKSKDFISHWDMFHIPFNKRYLIENQRYSLTGQPLLYLSSSPYGVIRELGTTEDVRISTFRVAENVSFNIYENINKFNEIILEGDNLTPKDSADYMLNKSIFDDSNKIISAFYQMILASCCSFERREDTRKSCFSEEYVIPQVLTLVLKQHDYDGVKYISTKAHTDNDIINSQNIINVLYSNICLFTDYTDEQSKDEKNVYDRELYNKFILSNPHKYNEDIPEASFLIDDGLRLIDAALNAEYIHNYENEILINIGNLLNELSDFAKTLPKNGENRFSEINKSISLHSLLLRNIILNIQESKLKNIEGGFINE